jgi:GNAT superfamily N-acetyltransferase
MLTKEQVVELVRQRLRGWPLYSEEHTVSCVPTKKGMCIGYRTQTGFPMKTTYFDVEVQGKTFYVLHIEIVKSERGKGYGYDLYLRLESLARDLDCNEINMTPSGTTYKGEQRGTYLKRKLGYKVKDGLACKELKDDVG